jgi:hypothetical protein
MRRTPDRDVDVAYDEHAVVVTEAKHDAAGVKAAMVSKAIVIRLEQT